MKYQRLGRSGLYVSKICLGTANFGVGSSRGRGDWGVVEERDAFTLMDYALDNGIQFFDTANVYGGLDHRGLTETILGCWFKQGGNRREKVVLGTKVGRVFEQSDLDGPNNVEGLSLYKIRRHVEDSLRRLQTEHVELIQMHKPDPATPWDEIWEAFEGLVRAGKVDYVGSSNHAAWQIVKAQECARGRGFMGLVSEQHLYTPMSRMAEEELLPMAQDQGIGVTIFSPLFRGMLGLDAQHPHTRIMSAECKALFERWHDRCVRYSALCRKLGESEACVTLAWELSHPAVTSVIVAPTCVQDLKELLRAVEIQLDSDTMKAIDDIFPPIREASPYI